MRSRLKRSRRPSGKTNPGCAGVFLILFGGFFAFMGIAAGMTAWRDKKVSMPMMGIIGPGIFVVVGLAIAVGGIALVRGHLRRRRPAKLPDGTSKLASAAADTFPKLSTRKPMPGGTVSLLPETTLRQGCFGLFFFSVIWNGVTWTALFALPKTDDVPIWVKILLGVFALIGILLVVGFVNTLIKLLFVGESHIELPTEPMAPGQTATVRIFQHGSLAISKVTVHLLAREKVSYRSGTDRVTQTEDVYIEPVAELANLTARGKDKPTAEVEIRVPEDAMPSFHSSCNEITWGLKVVFDVPNRPDLDMFYPFRVAPAGFDPERAQ